MRAAGRYQVQHSLAAEAAGVARQAVGLARLRGNAQVTPLHVASTMLSAAGPLRLACLQCQSCPLQCRALQLGFSAELGRLPMAADMLPCGLPLSNALVAAFKRAESRLRRDSEEGRVRPAAPADKVGLEHLVISILDDPSVARIMHEAGFSISQVRARVEKAITLEQSNRASSNSTSPNFMHAKCSRTQPSIEAAVVVLDGSLELNLGSDSVQASQARPRAGLPTSFAGAATGDREKAGLGTSLQATCRQQKFTELTAENLKILCNALELRVPWHKDIVPEIATTVLQCRSGMMRRRMGREKPSLATWLLFHGRDSCGKKAVAQELAKLVFGSYTEFTSITLADEFTPVNSGFNSDSLKRERSRGSENGYCRKKLFEATLQNPHRVILINGIEQLDRDSEIGIKSVIADGRMRGCNGDAVNTEDAIIVLSCEVIGICSLASSPPVKQRRISRKDGEEEDDMKKTVKSRISLDLNACAEDGKEEKENLSDDVGFLKVVDGVFLFL